MTTNDKDHHQLSNSNDRIAVSHADTVSIINTNTHSSHNTGGHQAKKRRANTSAGDEADDLDNEPSEFQFTDDDTINAIIDQELKAYKHTLKRLFEYKRSLARKEVGQPGDVHTTKRNTSVQIPNDIEDFDTYKESLKQLVDTFEQGKRELNLKMERQMVKQLEASIKVPDLTKKVVGSIAQHINQMNAQGLVTVTLENFQTASYRFTNLATMQAMTYQNKLAKLPKAKPAEDQMVVDEREFTSEHLKKQHAEIKALQKEVKSLKKQLPKTGKKEREAATSKQQKRKSGANKKHSASLPRSHGPRRSHESLHRTTTQASHRSRKQPHSTSTKHRGRVQSATTKPKRVSYQRDHSRPPSTNRRPSSTHPNRPSLPGASSKNWRNGNRSEAGSRNEHSSFSSKRTNGKSNGGRVN